MEVNFREEFMPACLAWRGTPYGFKVLRSPVFRATMVRADLHSLVPHPTMPLEECCHYGVALSFSRALIQFAA